MPRRSYAGGAKATRLGLGVDATATSIVVEDATGWPDTSIGPFFIVFERGTANEEKALVGQRNGVNLQNITRGVDGTAGISHQPLATVEHVFTATDAAEANAHVNATGAAHGTGSALVGVDDAQTLKNKTISANHNTITGLTIANIGGLQADLDAIQADVDSAHSRITTETNTRINEDDALDSRIDGTNAALAAESTARQTADNAKLDKVGGSISGNLAVGGTLSVSGATTVPAPTANGHASTKKYVDDEIAKVVDVFYGTGAPPSSGMKQGDVYLKWA